MTGKIKYYKVKTNYPFISKSEEIRKKQSDSQKRKWKLRKMGLDWLNG